MLDFDGLSRQVQEYKKLYNSAQSHKDDAVKQAMTVLVYETMTVELTEIISVCERFKALHCKSGVRIMTEKIQEKK